MVKHIISLGAGVQSSTMALMAAHGEITPMPDVAIFADTGWESSEVYRWLAWLEGELPFPIVRVRRKGRNLGELAIAVSRGIASRAGSSIPPWHLANPTGMLPIQCSKEFKTRVIQRYIRETLLGLQRGQAGPKEIAIYQWLGMSLDEAHRQKDCEHKYIKNCYPLIEKEMTRRDCLDWMASNAYPRPPRSSCIFCPFRSDAEWVHLRDNNPNDWQAAILFDGAIRRGYEGMTGAAFVHPQRLPLDRVTLRPDIQKNLFGNECEGVCGV